MACAQATCTLGPCVYLGSDAIAPPRAWLGSRSGDCAHQDEAEANTRCPCKQACLRAGPGHGVLADVLAEERGGPGKLLFEQGRTVRRPGLRLRAVGARSGTLRVRGSGSGCSAGKVGGLEARLERLISSICTSRRSSSADGLPPLCRAECEPATWRLAILVATGVPF